MQPITELLGWRVLDVSLVVYGFRTAWAVCLIGAAVKYIFRASDGKNSVFEE